MTQLVGFIVSQDVAFTGHLGSVLRASAIPVTLIDDRSVRDGTPLDLIIVDARGDAASAMAIIERLRVDAPAATVFAVAAVADSELILQAMRAGANEFLTWPPADDVLQAALRRTVTRREGAQSAPKGKALVFVGAKGGSGTTTIAVNAAVDIARLSKRSTVVVDLKPSLGEVSLFLGVRSQYSVVDAIDNLHRLDKVFLRTLVVKHKSGLDILAASDQFDRPGPADSTAVEELLALLTRQYDYVLVDVGNQINSVSLAALYMADLMCLVATPDVPSVRNTQRLLDRVRQLGARGDRTRILLNRTSEPLPIPLAQIESALSQPIDHTFPSDYKTVSTALNSGVPLALAGASGLSVQFDSFAKKIVDPSGNAVAPAPAVKRGPLGLGRIASLW
jgi:pilus assembly protein CpaE